MAFGTSNIHHILRCMQCCYDKFVAAQVGAGGTASLVRANKAHQLLVKYDYDYYNYYVMIISTRCERERERHN